MENATVVSWPLKLHVHTNEQTARIPLGFEYEPDKETRYDSSRCVFLTICSQKNAFDQFL